MKKLLVTVLLATCVVGIFTSVVESQRRRRRGRQPAVEAVAPRSEAIAPALGELRWGMTRDEVYQHFLKKIQDDYRPRMAKAPDAIEEDRLRAEQNTKIRRLRESVIEFTGQQNGWDVSFLRDEYTHRNGESMLVFHDNNSQNFYFFINNRLWKWFKAFDASVFQGQTFAQFTQALQGRFGPAVERTGRLIEVGDERHWLEWQDDTTRLRGVDLTQFYGFYCLVFEEKATVARLAELRVNRSERAAKRNSVIDTITQPGTDDSNADIVDRLTGKIRNRQDAPADAGAATKNKQ